MKNNFPMTPHIKDQLLATMGLGGLDDSQKEEAFHTVLQALNLSIGPRVLDTLNDQQLNELDELTTRASDEEIDDWLTQNVPDLHKIVEEEARKMRDEAIEDVNTAMEIKDGNY